MAVNTSIQSSTNLKVDQIVVISVDLLQSLLESNNKQHEAIKHLSDTMEKFVNEFLNTRMENESLRDQYRSSVKTNDSNVSNHSMTSSDELQQEILAKLDALSRTLASNIYIYICICICIYIYIYIYRTPWPREDALDHR